MSMIHSYFITKILLILRSPTTAEFLKNPYQMNLTKQKNETKNGLLKRN
jgi:hypothetical protein